ncbi:MAG: GNAT family N-acetyltransferase [Anaerolineales bacterium]|nr:GNAT family N-acetyltransferase [Anaerolineales bacterium]
MNLNKMLYDIPTRFESQRLVIRCYEPGDGEMYFNVAERNRQHLTRYESGNVILTIQNAEAGEVLVRQLQVDWLARKHFFIGAFEKTSGEFVAQIYVGPVNWELPEFSIGYFADCEHEGLGYVTEALCTILDFLFKDLGAHRLRLGCADTNLRSARVAERCGFRREGHIRENHTTPDGAYEGSYLYGLLRSEYLTQES